MAPRRNADQAELDAEEPEDVMVSVLPTHEFLKFSSRRWSFAQKKDFKTRRTANLKKPVRAGEHVSWETLAKISGPGEGGLPKGDQTMKDLTRMEYFGDDGNVRFVSFAWTRLFQIR